MMSCDTAKRMLSDYIERTLSPDDFSSVEEHLMRCPDCKHIFEDVAYLTEKLRSLPLVQTTEEFDTQLRLRISDEFMMEHPIITKKNLTFGLSGAALIAVIAFFIVTTMNTNTVPMAPPSSDNVMNQTQQMASPIISNRALKTAASNFSGKKDTIRQEPQTLDRDKIKLVDQEKH